MPPPSSAALSAEEDFSKTKTDYTARDIAVLEGIQAIRPRPGMYIGSTSISGLVHLLWEALDNAVDEASSTALSSASQSRCTSPLMLVEPMYMPGRGRMAWIPSRTAMSRAV